MDAGAIITIIAAAAGALLIAAVAWAFRELNSAHRQHCDTRDDRLRQ